MLNIFKSMLKNDAYENLQATEFLTQFKSTPAEAAAGMLENAKIIDFNSPDFAKSVSKLDKEKTYFLYCRSGMRSASACRTMHEMGFTNLFNLSGGYLSV
jgi:phage shock protein E